MIQIQILFIFVKFFDQETFSTSNNKQILNLGQFDGQPSTLTSHVKPKFFTVERERGRKQVTSKAAG